MMHATAWSPLLLAPASPPFCLPRSFLVFHKCFWGDAQCSFCSAKCLVQHGKWSMFKENQTAHPPQQSFPACLPSERERHLWSAGRAAGAGSPWQKVASPVETCGQPEHWGRESSGFMVCRWQSCKQGQSDPSHQLAHSAVFTGSVERTHFTGDAYHYPVLLKYSLCSRLELVRLLSSQVGGWCINPWVLQPQVN